MAPGVSGIAGQGSASIVFIWLSITQHFALDHNRGGHMAGNRTVTDAEGRVWTCMPGGKSVQRQGQDVVLTCTTPEIPEPVMITVGWQWEKMSPKGLARLISAAAA
jgi:hypothetical protein